MTEQDKQLLLRDLCTRLPYGVIVQDRNGVHKLSVGNTEFADLFAGKCNIKAYLRPLSSMTEGEAMALFRVIYPACHVTKVIIKEDCIKYIAVDNERGNSGRLTIFFDNPKICNLAQLDWFLANHFDVRGLIPKGLAIAAVGENNPYKEKGGDQC